MAYEGDAPAVHRGRTGSEDLLEKIFSSINVLIAYMDRNFNFIRVNENYAKADGKTPEFFVGRNHFELYPNAENEALFREVVATGKPFSAFEKPFTYPDRPGEITYWDWSLQPVFDNEGRVEGVVMSLIDVTERVRFRRRVSESERKFRTLFDSASDAIFIHDLRGRLLEVNRTAWERLGYSRAELIGKSLADLHGPDAYEAVKESIEKVAESGQATFETRHLDSRGRAIPVEVNVRLMAFDGRPAFLSVARDISRRKETEATLRRVNRALKTLSNCNQVLIHATDEGDLLRAMCAVLTDVGGYRLAWVGYKQDDEERSVHVMAAAGPALAYLEGILVTWSDAPTGQGPVGAAMRSGLPQIIRQIDDPEFQPWRDRAAANGVKSLIALPLRDAGKVFGALAVYAGEADAFDGEEEELLTELADDLAYGIVALRTRVERQQSLEKLERAMESAVRAVAATSERRDPYTAGHQRRVAELAAAIAAELGLTDEEIKGIHMAGIVHDIGKIYVPSEILNRPGRLNAAEMDMIRTHCEVGFDILKSVEFPWPVAEMVLQHHEKIDGSGYPRGLSGDQILLGAKILTVADVVEAMASHRPYRPGLGLDAALAEIIRGRGSQYDERVVDACLRLFREDRFTFQA